MESGRLGSRSVSVVFGRFCGFGVAAADGDGRDPRPTERPAVLNLSAFTFFAVCARGPADDFRTPAAGCVWSRGAAMQLTSQAVWLTSRAVQRGFRGRPESTIPD